MKTLAFLAITAAAGSAQVQSQPVYDISGVEVDGAAPTTLSVFNHDHSPLAGIGWDVAYFTGSFGPLTTHDGRATWWDATSNVGDPCHTASWASELNFVLTHVDTGFSFTFDGLDSNFADTGPADIVFGWGNSSGIFSAWGDIFFDHPFPVKDAYGLWEIMFFDEFDNAGIDGVFLIGSEIELIIPPAPSSTPAPASPGALALIGVGGIALARRRR